MQLNLLRNPFLLALITVAAGAYLTQEPIAVSALMVPDARRMRSSSSSQSRIGTSFSSTHNSIDSSSTNTGDDARRDFLRRAITSTITGAVFIGNQRSAYALKPNNEALCGTGFFTNIAQYKCTDIGDISDEGQSRKMSSEEESSLDSLMGKFDLSGGSDIAGSLSDGSSSEKGEGGNDGKTRRGGDQM